jgi:uncharacterized protein (DUF362 family)
MKISRRTFVKSSLAVGAASLTYSSAIGEAFGQGAPDIAAVKGADPFADARKAVEALGGMKKFVKKGARVGLLVNAPKHWKLEGSHTCTPVVVAVAKMCLEAGAKELIALRSFSPDIWRRWPDAEQHKEVTAVIKDNGGAYVEKPVKGVFLHSAQVIKELLEVDVFINVPVAKHHKGTHFTGNLKNFMGGLKRETNQFFHVGRGKTDFYEDVEHLSQCIADVNTLRKPDLCVVDATNVLATNGPEGPGEMLQARKVVAGVDPVAVDAYCVTLHGRKPAEIVMLGMAAAHGIGRADLSKLTVREIAG